MADNNAFWNEYEKQTGIKRPEWIDGVGNVNYKYGKKDPPPPKPLKAEQAISVLPQVRRTGLSPGLMPAPTQNQPWRYGLRGWNPGW